MTRSRNDGPGGTEELVITGQGNKSDLPDNRKEGKLPSPFTYSSVLLSHTGLLCWGSWCYFSWFGYFFLSDYFMRFFLRNSFVYSSGFFMGYFFNCGFRWCSSFSCGSCRHWRGIRGRSSKRSQTNNTRNSNSNQFFHIGYSRCRNELWPFRLTMNR